jgi:hypothetical protein
MQKLGKVLAKVDLTNNEDKYLSREFQKYGIYLSEKLEDPSHKSLYIRLAKTVDRKILDAALSFVLDAQAKSKARLFMWKVTQLRKTGSSWREQSDR